MELKKFPINFPLKAKRLIITGIYEFSVEKTNPRHTSYAMENRPEVTANIQYRISNFQCRGDTPCSPFDVLRFGFLSGSAVGNSIFDIGYSLTIRYWIFAHGFRSKLNSEQPLGDLEAENALKASAK